jgi:predicted TPR repeat methyltransferase
MNQQTDYRLSHTAPDYGTGYHRMFSDAPYRKYIWETEKRILNELLARYFDKRIENYLDFACGTGRILTHIEPHARQSVGLDLSDSMLEVAAQGVSTSSLLKGDITSEPLLQDERFDLITAFRFFLNAQPQLRDEVMRELAARLADTGYLVFNIHNNTYSLTNAISVLYTAVRYRKRAEFNQMSVAEVRALTAKHGLNIVQIVPYATYPVFHEQKEFAERFVAGFDRKFSHTLWSRYLIYVCEKVR